jgi:hypothetical protein
VRKRLTSLLAAEAKKLRSLGIRKLLRRKRVSLPFAADEGGTLTLRLTGSASGHASRTGVVASGTRTYTAPGTGRVTLKLTSKGARMLKRATRLRASLRATFKPTTGTPTSVAKGVRLKR